MKEGPVIPTVVALPKSHEGDQEEKSPEGEDHEGGRLLTYQVMDLAGNTLVLVERTKREGHEIKAQALSLQYNRQSVLALPANREDFEWALTKTAALKELEQSLKIRSGRDPQEVTAKFSYEKNQTLIKREDPRPEIRAVKPGLVLLRLATDKGKLLIEY